MKKLLLILSAIFVSVMGWAQLNPYAYGLSSSWNNATKKLTVTYSLNSAAYNDGAGGDPDGVQIHLTDDKNDPKKYYIYGVPPCCLGKGKQTFTIDLSSGLDRHGKTIPENKNLYVAITVQGNRKISKPYMYSPENNANNEFKVYSPHGIAVDKDPNSPNFGNIYVNEGWQATTTGFNTGKAGMYVIDATFDKFNTTCYTGNYDFSKYVIQHTYDGLSRLGYQPWRVRVSDDGRIFVCSNDMHQRQTSTNASGERDGVAVWEVSPQNLNSWTPVLKGYRKSDYTFAYKDVNGNDQFIGPICGMDIKGTGDDLTLLLYTVNKSGVQLNMSGFRAYEYNVKAKTLKPISAFNEGTYGYIFEQVTLRYGVDGSYWFGASRADGSDGINTNGKTKEPNLGHVKLDGATADYTNYNAEFYAGAGLINYKSTYNSETINGANHSWLIAGKDNNGNANGLFDVFLVTSSADGGAGVTRMDGNDDRPNWQGISVKNTGRNLNDFAIDYAENLYIAGNGGNGGRVCAFAMPYGGEKTTIAREQYAFKYQNPVPNILATDLRCDIVRGKNQYEFSFTVNTKPEEAQIRFYESYEDMQKSLNVVNADDYDGTNNNKPVYVYNIPADTLKQGRIAVNLGAVGGQVDANGVITNNRLPAGVLYWSVYVKTRESKVFAPIYKQGTTGEDTHYRLHATVNNYPETDGFGHIYAAQYYSPTEGTKKKSLMVYNFNPDGNCDDKQGNISNSTRYKLVNEFTNPTDNDKPKFENQRRLAVAPDGKVYIADHGLTNKDQYSNGVWEKRPMMFSGGGIYVWDPKSQTGNEIVLQQFLKDKTETSSGVAIWNHGGNLKLYGLNTYGEFEFHTGKGGQETKLEWKGYEYTPANQGEVTAYGWNGFKEYKLEETSDTVQRSLGAGDAGGNISIVAMDKGVWLAQHRDNDVQYTIDQFNKNNSSKPALPDNPSNYILSFVPYNSNSRTWTSCTTNGITYSGSNYTQPEASELTQLLTSPLQSCPGAGLAYRKTTDKEYLYIVNHTGDIVELRIDKWSGNTPTVVYNKTYTSSYTKGTNTGGRTSGAITSMSFDYAGNLITTSGQSYFGSGQDIIVYTMPYDRVNAREIQAPNSCRMIPERIAHLDMDKVGLDELIEEHKLDHPEGCAIDLFRPLQGGMFNTICLPCTLDLKTLPEDHPLKGATLKEYKNLTLKNIGSGEKVLELVFEDVADSIIIANKPYIIQPKDDYNSIIRFAGPLQLTNTVGKEDTCTAAPYSITYKGIIPYQEITPVIQDGVSFTLMLVADNRLAELTKPSLMYGFRGYFLINKPLPQGTQSRLSFSRPTATGLINVDGKLINVQKYLQEGRIYIRIDDQVYDLTGARVQ